MGDSLITGISPDTLRSWLVDGDELAVLDAREQGAYFHSHLFHAVNAPLSRLELIIDGLVPRLDTRIVWSNETDSGIDYLASAKLAEWGWTNQYMLEGGLEAWASTGGELYSGMNVVSKAFGEIVEHRHGTPRIGPADLERRVADGEDLVILDSRPMGEFRRRSIPGGVACPGAELVYRVAEVAPDPSTTVVVNCAGRTRSIIGAQSLINAGVPNPVVALENGTMGWELAGLSSARGVQDHAPNPGVEAEQWAVSAAASVGARYGVVTISRTTLAQWQADLHRTTYLFDVRTPGEYEASHLRGAAHAEGGQLVQATDEYMGTRNARVVLVDDNGVRATMTASWLRQMGWDDAVVLDSRELVGPDNTHMVKGKSPRSPRASVSVPTIRPDELAGRLKKPAENPGLAVIDVGSNEKYRIRGHIPGAWWAIRSRLAEARSVIGDAATVVFTSSDATIARLAARDAASHWPDAEILALAAGNKGWRHAGHEMNTGFDRATTRAEDLWPKPYDHPDDIDDTGNVDESTRDQRKRDYLTWETGLVEQLERDPTVKFTSY